MQSILMRKGLASVISIILIISAFTFTVSAVISIQDNSPDIAGTGDSFIVNATVSDDDGGINSVWVEYWFEAGLKTNVSMTNTGGDYWEYDNISIPLSSDDDLYYNISAENSTGVWDHLNNQQVIVTDVIPPSIVADSGNVSVGTGDSVILWINATDNIGVISAEVFIDGGTGINMSYNAGLSLWEYNYTASNYNISAPSYTLTVYDNESLSNSSGPYTITVNDDESPEINDVQAIPSSIFQGGYINITCELTDNIEVDTVTVNITYPDSSYHNETMNKVGMAVYEDFTTFEELDPNNHINVTPTRVTQEAWHNEDSYVVNDYGTDYFTNFTHYLDVCATYGPNNRGKVFWQIANLKAPYSTLFYSYEVYISIYLWNGNLQMTEHLHNTEFYDASTSIDFNTIYYLIINKNGTNMSCEVYTDSERTNHYDTINLTLHDNHKFRYLYVANSWNTGSAQHADGWCENLDIGAATDYFYETNYTMLGNYTYFIWANDTSGNSNMSATYQFTVKSNDPPTIVDNSPDTAGTGDSFVVNATVTDDEGVSSVWVEHWFDGGNRTNESMTRVGMTDYYEIIIDIPGNSTDDLWYNISANDTFDVWSHLYNQQVVVTDDDLPTVANVYAIPNFQEVDGYINISCNVTDNIIVDEVFLNITHPDTSIENFSITQNKTGNTY
ncbi:MAG: hypothetical protein JSW06_03715 [Thermoplasmatales archaeon]|nr:MAG: hypothetical protein JSW06_03715 [Thermoplasmatales archaeon]